MKFEIKSRWSGKVLFSAETKSLKLAVEMAVGKKANLCGANLSGANLCGANMRESDLRGANLWGAYLREANLRGADLRGADLCGANLRESDLRGANLRGANLWGANLRGADLREAIGVNKYLTTPLYILQDQIGKIRAYKLTKYDAKGPYYPEIKYKVGETYNIENANCDEQQQCAAGISLATLDWCIKEWKEGYRIFIAEFTTKDIAAIPIASDGKFRVHKCKIIAEKDLKEIGLIK